MTGGGDGYSQPTNYVMKTALCELFRPTRLLALCCVAWLMGAVFSAFAEAAVPPQVPSAAPVSALPVSATNDALKAAVREVQEVNAQYVRVTHGLQYSEPDLKALKDDIVKLETQIYEKRKALEQKLAQFPEVVKLEKARREAFERLQKARGVVSGTTAGR